MPAAESHPDPPLASFPLRIDWEATLPVIPEAHDWPAPESGPVVLEPADYADRRPMVTLVKQAEAKGWTVRVTRAVGAWPSVAGRPSRQRASLAARMHRADQRAIAIYLEGPSEGSAWSWDSFYRWGRGEGLKTYPMITPFRASLE